MNVAVQFLFLLELKYIQYHIKYACVSNTGTIGDINVRKHLLRPSRSNKWGNIRSDLQLFSVELPLNIQLNPQKLIIIIRLFYFLIISTVSVSTLSSQYCTGSACLCPQPCKHDAQLNSKLDHCALIVEALMIHCWSRAENDCLSKIKVGYYTSRGAGMVDGRHTAALTTRCYCACLLEFCIRMSMNGGRFRVEVNKFTAPIHSHMTSYTFNIYPMYPLLFGELFKMLTPVSPLLCRAALLPHESFPGRVCYWILVAFQTQARLPTVALLQDGFSRSCSTTMSVISAVGLLERRAAKGSCAAGGSLGQQWQRVYSSLSCEGPLLLFTKLLSESVLILLCTLWIDALAPFMFLLVCLAVEIGNKLTLLQAV